MAAAGYSNLTIPAAPAVNRAAAGSATRAIAAAGARSVVPLTYGEDRLGALILNVLPTAAGSTTLLVQCLWGHAGDGVLDVRLNNLPLPAVGYSVTHYSGAQTAPDPALVTAFAAQGITYTDTLQGYQYSVLQMPIRAFSGQLDVSARVRGRRVYDRRKDSSAGGSGNHRLANPLTWEWSDEPALCLADFLASSVYGPGKAVDWSTVPAAANANDQLIGTPAEPRRRVGVSFVREASARDVAEALRAYAGCWLVPGAAGLRLVPDADGPAVASYDHGAGAIARLEPLALRDMGDLPTAVEVFYTDTAKLPWREGSALATLPGAGSTLPWRLSVVRLPGIQRYSQAYREAVERLNKLTLTDMTTAVEVFDIGIRHDRGDIIELTHPVGLAAKKMRVTGVTMPGPGRWLLRVAEHDAGAYSSAVLTAPTVPDTAFVTPAGPPSAVSGLTATAEELGVRLRWSANPEVDVAEYVLRVGGTDWATAAPLHGGALETIVGGTTLLWAQPAAGTYTFRIRALDAEGLMSQAEASVSITVAATKLAGIAPGANATSVDANGQIQGVAQGAGTPVANSLVTINPNGTLGGAGAGQANLASLPGQVGTAQIANAALTAAKFAAGIEPVAVITGAVPATKSTNAIYRTDDGKLYRWSGTAYTAAVLAADLSGHITSTQITDGAITTPKMSANSINGDRIAANTLDASKIIANSITAGQIAAGAISAAQLAAGAVTAGKIAAGAVTATEIAANTITADRMQAGVLAADNVLTRGLTVRDNSGNVILSAGQPLQPANAAPGLRNSELVPSISAAAQTALWSGVSGRPAEDAIRNNLIDLSWWRRDGARPWPSNSEFNRLMTVGTAGADIAVPGPKGGSDIVWYAEEIGEAFDGSNSGPGGGWNAGTFVGGNLDPTKTYRLVLPVRVFSGSGSYYWGGYGLCDLNTTNENGNPYFAAWNGLQGGRWYLFVGYVFPYGSTNNTQSGAGVYDCSTGELVAVGANWNHALNGMVVHRAYQYYAAMNASCAFGRPMCNLVDGTEPSLREYFDANAVLNAALVPSISAAATTAVWSGVSGTGRPEDNATRGAPAGTLVAGDPAQNVVRPGNPISAGNITTYIQGAAIGTAQIQNAAITNALIGNAEISSLKIQGNAVTVPIGWESVSDQTFPAPSGAYITRINAGTVNTEGSPLYISATIRLTKASNVFASDTFVGVFVGETLIQELAMVGPAAYSQFAWVFSRVLSAPGTGSVPVTIRTRGLLNSDPVTVNAGSLLAGIGCKR